MLEKEIRTLVRALSLSLALSLPPFPLSEQGALYGEPNCPLPKEEQAIVSASGRGLV